MVRRSALLHVLLITAISFVSAVILEDAGAGGREESHVIGSVDKEDGQICSVEQGGGGCVMDAYVEVHPVELESSLFTIVYLGGDQDPDLPSGPPSSPCLAATADGRDDSEPGCTVIYRISGAEIHRHSGVYEGMPTQVLLRCSTPIEPGFHVLSIEVRGRQGEPVGSDKAEFVWNRKWQDTDGDASGKPDNEVERVVSGLAKWYEGEGEKEARRVSRIRKLQWEGLDCSLPRGRMRVYELENVKVQMHVEYHASIIFSCSSPSPSLSLSPPLSFSPSLSHPLYPPHRTPCLPPESCKHHA
jgi:hypothetical protein